MKTKDNSKFKRRSRFDKTRRMYIMLSLLEMTEIDGLQRKLLMRNRNRVGDMTEP